MIDRKKFRHVRISATKSRLERVEPPKIEERPAPALVHAPKPKGPTLQDVLRFIDESRDLGELQRIGEALKARVRGIADELTGAKLN